MPNETPRDALSAFADEVLLTLRTDAGDMWRELNEDQKPIVRQVARDLAKYTALYVQEPDQRERHAMTLKHLQGILESEAALAQLRVAGRVKDAIAKVARGALELALGLIGRR